MARYKHLQLLRLPEQLERRKTGRDGRPPERNAERHSTRLREELDQAIDIQQRRRRPEFVDPSLILRVRMTGTLLEEDWNNIGLTVLSSDEDRTLVLFSSSDDMTAFRDRLAAYGRGTLPGRKHPPYEGFIARIEAIGTVEPRDRIGVRAREEGFTGSDDFQAGTIYTVDVELWDVGRRDLRTRKLEQIAAYAVAREGEELDRYIGPSITMVRLRCDGAVVRALLGVEDICEIDLPPTPDIATGEAMDLGLADLPPLGEVDENAPLIGIIDSGVNAHPLLDDILVGAISVPGDLGVADECGHGTRVAGISVFGNLRGQLAAGMLDRRARLCAAKVVNERGEFPDRRLTPGQMREAISRLYEEFRCRIFVIALGDRRRIYDGGKVGPWAATLDELAAELDVVIIVSVGNRDNIRSGNRIEEAVTEYPGYLLEPSNRLCEPAGAMNVITVGSLAHGEGLGQRLAGNVGVRPITREAEPSPFSRIGPGIGGAIKPDFVDIGGTLVFDPLVRSLLDGKRTPEAGVLSLHHHYVDRLFAGCSGTSFSAPLVAFKASRILTLFPTASANLIRALLGSSAAMPEQATFRLLPLGDDAGTRICGRGVVDLERATYSDDARVVLYAEDELAIDHFAVYQIPIPEPFQSEPGRRTIRVSLAYAPPVRHSRIDYRGVTMNYRLIRGCDPDEIFEYYRRRIKEEGPVPEFEKRYNCKLEPGPTLREKSSLQVSTATFKRDVSHYGDNYYLVVRCASGWAGDNGRQTFAVVVEIEHEAQIRLYERLRVRLQR